MQLLYIVQFVLFVLKSTGASNDNKYKLLDDNCTSSQCTKYAHCFATEHDGTQAKWFSTKTAYPITTDTRTDELFQIPNCRADRFWILVRHGTRLPSEKDINTFAHMSKLRDRILAQISDNPHKSLCAEDVDLLRAWQWDSNITADRSYDLVAQGVREMQSIASNYQRRFPHLLPHKFDSNSYHFRHTERRRTHDSFRAFASGLFYENEYEAIDARPPSSEPDLLLKGYSHCSAWKQLKKSMTKSKHNEITKFKASATFLDMIDEINSRFGFDGSLSVKDIENIHDLCRYESAWHPTKGSIWCSLLTPQQFLAFQYFEELKYYYKSNYGSPVYASASCYTVADMLRRMSSDEYPKATAYFSHATALHQLVAALGALKDEARLTVEQFHAYMHRNWRTSRVVPFAANVAAVRYDCQDGAKMKFSLNEQPLQLEWCEADGVCDWAKLNQQYSRYGGDSCDSFYCKLPNAE